MSKPDPVDCDAQSELEDALTQIFGIIKQTALKRHLWPLPRELKWRDATENPAP
jgi:hypothetical protein